MEIKCPKGIKHGHCDKCHVKKAKKCDFCGSKDDVVLSSTYYELSHSWKCLCMECRCNAAERLSRSRSW